MKKILLGTIVGLVLCGCTTSIQKKDIKKDNLDKDSEITEENFDTREILLPENYKFMDYKFLRNGTHTIIYKPMKENDIPEVYIVDKKNEFFDTKVKYIIYETKDGVKAELPE